MQLNSKQLELINQQIQRLIGTDSYYGKMYRDLGIDGIHSQEDFEKLPFSSKDDLRNAYPLGIQAVPDSEIVRIHSSSGTTGKPVIIPYTAKDVDDWATMFARCYEIAGIGKLDRIQITPGYGLWTAGIGFQLGAEKLGAMAIPMGPGNTEKQLQFIIHFMYLHINSVYGIDTTRSRVSTKYTRNVNFIKVNSKIKFIPFSIVNCVRLKNFVELI